MTTTSDFTSTHAALDDADARPRLVFVGSLASIHTQRWVRFFAGREWDVHAISPSVPEGANLGGATVHAIAQIRTGRPLADLVFNALALAPKAFALRRRLRSIRPHVVHVHYLNELALLARLAGARPLVATAWGSDVLIAPKESAIRRRVVSRILRDIDLVTCDAEHMRDALLELGAPAERTEIIYFGTNVEQFTPAARDPALIERHELQGRPTVVSLRNLEPVYDVETYLRAVPAVRDVYPDVRFLVGGSGSEESKLRALASSLDISANVVFLGRLAEAEMAAHIRLGDVYVSTSLSDGGLAASTAEAMACELPAVVTDVCDNADWVEDGVSGRLFPPSDPAALALRLLELLGDAEKRTRMGRAGRRTIVERNNWCREMERMETLYERLLPETLRAARESRARGPGVRATESTA